MKSRLLIIALLFAFAAAAQRNEVYFVPTLYGLHQSNKYYNYDSLQRYIRRLKPDIIAVEMRTEDLDADTFYLKKNYPYEMVMMRYWFRKTDIVGIDWLGDDIDGQPIPANYWKEISPIKQYEQALRADTFYTRKCRTCDSINMERMLLLQSQPLKKLLQGKDSVLTAKYYECLENQLSGSVHRRILEFYNQRNEAIRKHIMGLLQRHKKTRIVIVVGNDRYFYLKDLAL